MRNKIAVLLVLNMVLAISVTVRSDFKKQAHDADLDPLVDVEVTIEVKGIRYFEDEITLRSTKSKASSSRPVLALLEMIQNLFYKNKAAAEAPSMYLKVFINDQEFESPVYPDQYYVYNPDFSSTVNVPDDEEFVDVKIQLWYSDNIDGLCDISPEQGSSEEARDVEIQYSIKTGKWSGEDYLGDPSGYGRLSGTEDGSIYEKENDCELWFEIYQNDFDDDGIPYWTETNTYSTNPEVADTGDPDNDEVPVDWEYKWGYNPFEYENHQGLDPEGDSLNNWEEYKVSEWYSDPYLKDVFIEMDMMEEGPNGEKSYYPNGARELIYTAFNRQNILMHIDMGEMGGFELVPFMSEPSYNQLRSMYNTYFLHNDNNNWRKGVFHYGIVIYDVRDGIPPGSNFRSNAWFIASQPMEEDQCQDPFLGCREVVYGSVYMHELGHNFAFNPIPGHNRLSMYPWQPLYWYNRAYYSCMNYGWTYQMVDYSNGSNREPDIDDWARIDYSNFDVDWD
jgi:hypothetical protein